VGRVCVSFVCVFFSSKIEVCVYMHGVWVCMCVYDVFIYVVHHAPSTFGPRHHRRLAPRARPRAVMSDPSPAPPPSSPSRPRAPTSLRKYTFLENF
jgi:hypothetical protein